MVILADPEQCDVWIEDASIAAIIIQLAAESLGLGSCWIQVRERWHTKEQTAEDYIKNLLGIPERYRIECMIAVGYKGKKNYPTKKKSYTWINFILTGFKKLKGNSSCFILTAGHLGTEGLLTKLFNHVNLYLK